MAYLTDFFTNLNLSSRALKLEILSKIQNFEFPSDARCLQSASLNSRALNSEKPCINKEFHAPIMHRYSTFHMQDSGQYSINTEEAPGLQLKLSIKQFTQELCRFVYSEKMTEQATLNETVVTVVILSV